MANELFRFTLTDNTSGSPVTTVIEEPVGWDGVEFEYVRLPTHGFVNNVNIEGINFEFRGDARTILKNAFDDYGIEANVTILIERRNNPSESFTTIYEGLMKFTDYKEICGIDCFVSCGITQQGAYYLFNNRKDQAVDTNASTSFDGTALSAYTWLNKSTLIPAKELQLEYAGNSPAGSGVPIEPMQDLAGYLLTGACNDMFFLRMPTDNITSDEITEVANFDQAINAVDNVPNGAFINPYGDFFEAGLVPNLDFQPSTRLQCTNLFSFDINIDVDVTLTLDQQGVHGGTNDNFRFVVYLCHGAKSNPLVVSTLYAGPNTILAPFTTVTQNFTISPLSLSNIQLKDGDYLVWGIIITGIVSANPAIPFLEPTQYQISANINTYNFSLTNNSACQGTYADLSMVNEVLSRQVEAYTNDEIRVKSDYFGREDSEPYTSASNGCGSLETLSLGLQIREAFDESITRYYYKKDFDFVFDNLHQIHNLGYGLEPDSSRGGTYQWLRIEPYAYWYDSSVLFTLTDVNTIETQYSKVNTPSKIIVGYQNWATEEQGGRQDVFAKREYRSNLTRENNSIDLRSQLIASDFALEVIRRLFGMSNIDNQYDNETFIIEMKKASDYEVFLLGTGATSSYIYSLFTMKNTSLTPVRNLMRHINRLTNWTRTNLAYLFKFTDGQANFIAEINQDSQNNCPIEVASTTVAENQDIDESVIDTDYNFPILSDKEVDFEYPITCAQYDLIVANPYGLIGYTCGGVTQYGWIKRFTFNPNTSIANFQLFQKWS